MDKDSLEYEEISHMFGRRIEKEINGASSNDDSDKEITTKAYSEFKEQYLPKKLSIYEKVCQFSEKTFPVKPDDKKYQKYKEAINVCHLNTSPTGVFSAALLIPLLIIITAMLLFFVLPIMLGKEGNLFFVGFSVMGALALMIPLQNLPFTFANSWRMKASNQMVMSVFYMVTYMRHTSNLELAVTFAADHLAPPLSLDLRKVVWNVETQKFESIKESLTDYLDTWRDNNMEFVESVHLIQSSLYESTEERRIDSLEKSLKVILDETYEKMLHYAHGLKGPLTTLNMLGVVLPILTLVLLPLVVSFMEGFKWYHLFAVYNIALPLMVYYLGKNILSTRPGGSGNVDITEKNPELKKFKKIAIKLGDDKTLFLNPLYFCMIVGGFIVLLGLMPLIWHGLGLPDYGIVNEDGYSLEVIDEWTDTDFVKHEFLGYRPANVEEPDGEKIGPFGIGAVLIGLLLPFGFAYGIGKYNRFRTRNIITIRNQSKKLELEFSSALFQLGNRIGDGLPSEIAFGKVGALMENTVSGKFFNIVNVNITSLGMSVKKAIFDKERGALKYYPSDIIESSMKVLVESSKKGPLVASQAVLNVAEYIKQMHRVNERLNDLMGDVIASMRSQVVFLTPVISGIVVAITTLITKILGTLGDKLGKLGEEAAASGQGGALLSMFGVGIPTYQFQIVVGLYVVQLAYILTVISNGIENGVDDIAEEDLLGKLMIKSSGLYTILAFIMMVVFAFVAGNLFPK